MSTAVCIILVAVVLVVVLAVTLSSVVLARTKKHLATTEQRLAETTAALGNSSAALQRQRRQLNEMTSRYEQAHRDRQLLLAEASAHRAVEMAAKIPGLTDEERRAIAAKLEVAKANSPKVRIR